MGRGALLAASALAAAPLFLAPGPGAAADAVQARPAAATLCAAGETILFQCRTGLKLVSLCGRRTPVPAARLLYGNPGRFDYASSPGAAFSWMQTAGDISVRILDGEREHWLYSNGSGSGMDSDGRLGSHRTDGFMLDRGRGWPVDHRCAGEATQNGRLRDFMPEAEAEDD